MSCNKQQPAIQLCYECRNMLLIIFCDGCCSATDAQQQAANELAIAEATQHELQQQLAEKDTALQHQRQLEQSWRFRQLEASTRALATLEHLQGKLEALDAAAACFAAAVQQQHDSYHGELEAQLTRLAAWEAAAEELCGNGSRINTALVHMAQQWVAKQQKLRSSDKGMQVGSTGNYSPTLFSCICYFETCQACHRSACEDTQRRPADALSTGGCSATTCTAGAAEAS
jgi:hypothetical protein